MAIQHKRLGRHGVHVSNSVTEIKLDDEIFPGPGGEAPKAYSW